MNFKYIITLALLWLCFVYSSLTAQPNPKPKIVCTTTIIADIAQNIAANQAEVISILPIGADPHIYDPVPSDAKKLAEADLILINGLNLEGWLEKMIRSTNTKALVKAVSDDVNAISSKDHENSFDPHAWMTVKNGIKYAHEITQALISLRPEQSAYFKLRLENYTQKLRDLEVQIRSWINQIPTNQRIIITTHDAFRYYAQEYGFQVFSALGNTTDAQVQTNDMRRLAQIIERYKVPTIFVETTINPKLITQLAQDKGIKVGDRLLADSIGDSSIVYKGTLKEQPIYANTYLGMLEYNTAVIVEGLLAQSLQNKSEGAQWETVNSSFLVILLFMFALTFLWITRKVHPQPTYILNKDQNITINIQDLNVGYNSSIVLEGVCLEFNSGKIYGVVGANGSGKSTLIKAIVGLAPPQSGTITINNKPAQRYLSSIAYVPQREEIDWQFPAVVEDIVLMGRYPNKKVFQQLNRLDYESAANIMQQLGIYELRKRPIGSLSGGQQQRVFIARALCQNAMVYILDEPFAGIDAPSEQLIMQILKKLKAEGKLIIIIHHDLTKIKEYFDFVVILNHKPITSKKVKELIQEPKWIEQLYGNNLGMV